MPWILKVEASQQKEDFVLVCNVATTTTGERVYKIGRKDADINIPGEKIVSREHARIYVCPLSKESVYDIDSRPQVYIEDSSKFGTFIGGKNIGKNKQTLHDGDEITLGNNDSNRMVISFHQIIICPSKLKPKQELEASCRSIGAHIVSDWRNDCTHLCMTKAEVTPKLVLALASVKPVVRPDYFRSVAEGGLSELPDTRLYHPPVPETELGMDLSPLSERRTLFKGMKFILLSSDPLKRLAEILSSAGGTIHEAFDPKAPIPMPTDDEEASSSSSKCSLVVVLPAESDSASEAMDSVVNRYEKVRMLGIHGVQETNIYQAVLTANLEALNLVAPTAMPSQRTRKPSAPAQAAVRHKEPESDDEHVEEIGYRSKFQKRTRCVPFPFGVFSQRAGGLVSSLSYVKGVFGTFANN